jgi:hypothetical protein
MSIGNWQQLAQAQQERDVKIKCWEHNLQQYAEFPGVAPQLYVGNVTGISHGCYLRVRDSLHPDNCLIVKAHPENKYDANATGIYFGDSQVGWVPKAYNGVCAMALAAGIPLVATITAHHLDAHKFDQTLFIEIRPMQKGINSLSGNNPASVIIDEIQLTKSSQQEQQTMSKSLSNIIEQNVSLGTSAAFLEAGRIANNQLSSICAKKMPIMIRAYADTAMGRLILANLALMARDHFRPDDERLGKLANAMTVSAYQEVLQNFDVEQMIEDMLSNSTIKKALKSIDNAEKTEKSVQAK